MRTLKIIRYVAWGGVAVFGTLALALALGWWQVDGPGRPVVVRQEPTTAIGGPFTLTNHRREVITERSFLGRPFLVFFGFTHCPDVCPTTLFEVSEILRALGGMVASVFTGAKTEMDIAGPVGIVTLTKQMSELGLAYLLYFAAILSINLGIINILPIPALDGGHVIFTLYEMISGRKPGEKFMEYAQMAGMILLLGLMAYALGLDFWRFLFK